MLQWIWPRSDIRVRRCGMAELEVGDIAVWFEAKGRVEALLAILGARYLALSDEQRARIEACSNVAQLDRWIVRAVTAASVDDLLAP